MQTLLPYLAILVVILTGWGIAKKLQVTTLLLFAGLALNLLAILAGVDNILPRSAKTTGWIGFDLFELLRALSRSQIASTGFIILVAGGFATYMDKIGATNKLVALCTKPLSKLSAPYVILGAVFLLGHFLGLVVTSAAGLGTLLAVSVFPLLLGVGVSAVAASIGARLFLCSVECHCRAGSQDGRRRADDLSHAVPDSCGYPGCSDGACSAYSCSKVFGQEGHG